MAITSVVKRVQTALDDPAGSWADDGYVLGFMALSAEDLAIELDGYGLSYDTVVVTLTNVPGGTKDLSAFQAPGGLLDNLMVPLAIDWRPTGTTDDDWEPVQPQDKVEDIAPGQGQAAVTSYEWRTGVIYLSNFDQAVDLRVRFDQMPAVYDDESQREIPGVANALAYSIAAMIWATRGNTQRAALCQGKADKAKENFECLMVMKDQKVNRKIGRTHREGSISRLHPPVI